MTSLQSLLLWNEEGRWDGVMPYKVKLGLAAGLFVLGLSIFLGAILNKPEGRSSSVKPVPTSASSAVLSESVSETFKVTRVIDGDTIEIEGGKMVRYIGMDTPETVDPRRPVGCFGKEASDKNKELVEGKQVRLEKDISETDKYDRLLRYVYVGDPSTSLRTSIFVNDFLVRQGFAKISTYPPDVKYQDQFLEAEREAREKNLGLWSGCSISATPAATPKNSGSPQVSSGNCLIKGNISSSGEKIYHLPGQQYYNKTAIVESAGERWFCTEEEALSSGWRKSKV